MDFALGDDGFRRRYGYRRRDMANYSPMEVKRMGF